MLNEKHIQTKGTTMNGILNRLETEAAEDVGKGKIKCYGFANMQTDIGKISCTATPCQSRRAFSDWYRFDWNLDGKRIARKKILAKLEGLVSQ